MSALNVQHWTPAELIANYVAALDRDTADDQTEIDTLHARIAEREAHMEKRAHLRATHLALLAIADPQPSFDEVVSTMSGRIPQA